MTAIEEFPDILPDPLTMSKRWVWRDETNTLEQISTGFQPNSDKLNFNKVRDRRKGGTVKGLPKMTQVVRNKCNIGTVPQPMKAQSPNPVRNRTPSADTRRITLNDVKGVVFILMTDACEFADGFEEIMHGDQLDELLKKLLLYFDAFFDRVALDKKHENDLVSELSVTEKKAYWSVENRLEEAQKMLAKRYCILIMGLDTEKQHHMTCGKSRKSYTKKDKEFFENLYTYCSFIVWITFKRTHFELIQEELGRLFRSSTFNPHGVTFDDHEFKLACQLTKLEIKEITMAPSSVRKNRRPAIQSILNQRSPVLVSLFPNSKESGSWLLDRRTALPLSNKKKGDDAGRKREMRKTNMKELHVGIIGEFMRGFNPYNLAPFGDEIEEERREKLERRMSYRPSMDETSLLRKCSEAISIAEDD